MALLFMRMSGFSSSSSSASFSTGNDGGASEWAILMRDGCVRTESCVKIGWFSLAAVASSMLIDNNNSGTADADSLSEDWQLLGVAMCHEAGCWIFFSIAKLCFFSLHTYRSTVTLYPMGFFQVLGFWL